MMTQNEDFDNQTKNGQPAPERTIEGKYRQVSAPIGIVIRVISVVMCIYLLLYASRLLAMIGIFIAPATNSALFLSCMLFLVFLLIPARKTGLGNRIAWWDILLIIGSLVAIAYFARKWEAFAIGVSHTSLHETILGLILLLAVCEATRRTIGLPVVIIGLFFFLYAKYCYLIPGLFGGPKFSLSRVMVYVYMSCEGIFGPVIDITATIMAVFITFGVLLVFSGVGTFFTDLALFLVGGISGGPAKVAVISSGLFGTVSGSAVANVGVTGAFTIPMMKSVGYKAHFAGAVEAVASTGGIIMPPVMGAVAFVLAGMTLTPYATVCIAALLPAVLYFLSVFMQVHFEAVKTGLRGLPREELPSLRKVLKSWYFIIPVILLLVLIMIVRYDPILSCLYTMGAAVAVSAFRKETLIGPKQLVRVFEEATKAMMTIGPLCGLIGVITGSLMITGLGLTLGSMLVELARGNLVVLAIYTAAICYLLGMGVSAIASYILLAITVAPAMVQLGVPVLAAHLFILYMTCTTLITPPYCLAAYAAAPIAKADPIKIGFQAMRLGIVCYIAPFVFVFSPGLLLGQGGTLLVSIQIFITAIIGVIWLSAGVEGYLLRPTNWIERILLIGAGLSMIVPEWKSSVVGLILGMLVFLWQWRKKQLSHFSKLCS